MRRHRASADFDHEQQRVWNREWHRKARKANRALLTQIKTDQVCAFCQCHFPPEELHFHHTDPASKFKKVTRLPSYSRKRMLEEIEKCILLCPSCHTEHHYPQGRTPTPPETSVSPDLDELARKIKAKQAHGRTRRLAEIEAREELGL